jgi:hypothetical protein
MTCATHYSRTVVARGLTSGGCVGCRVGLAVWLIFLAVVFGQSSGSVSNAPAARAAEIFQHTQREHLAQPTNAELAWQFARACFDWAEFSTNDTQRADLAQLGIRASRTAIQLSSNSAPAHFYLAMNLGQLARTRSLGALPLVDEMETEFLTARRLDEQFFYAGPDRFVGQLYLQAPSIASVGSRSKARMHLKRALELAPEYPENRLNWIEACLRWRETELARRELVALEAGLERARVEFSGIDWAAAWADWSERLQKIRAKLKTPARTAGAQKIP